MTNPVADIARLEKSFERPLVESAELKERSAATQWLDDAWGIVQDEIPGVVRRMALPEDDPAYLRTESVARVVVAMVIRVLRNPDARRQLGEDTFQETIDAAVSTGQLYISETERGRLLASAEGDVSQFLPGVYNVSFSGGR
ncbi:MAG: hypothetical protein BGN97_03710 [Microbacterium sp. 69-10]|uniref:hypothetical protein n=1 Tax=Microbacterium sp. 69-10 TaxID=1895783 RepID=UPI000965847D|nr:hypothetical protein [Microbacterium sp. 69-10]OJU41818.1 MAG: hypothetical protein BGN97_03710 [Microbacterium sp. 69-10]